MSQADQLAVLLPVCSHEKEGATEVLWGQIVSLSMMVEVSFILSAVGNHAYVAVLGCLVDFLSLFCTV